MDLISSIGSSYLSERAEEGRLLAMLHMRKDEGE